MAALLCTTSASDDHDLAKINVSRLCNFKLIKIQRRIACKGDYWWFFMKRTWGAHAGLNNTNRFTSAQTKTQTDTVPLPTICFFCKGSPSTRNSDPPWNCTDFTTLFYFVVTGHPSTIISKRGYLYQCWVPELANPIIEFQVFGHVADTPNAQHIYLN